MIARFLLFVAAALSVQSVARASDNGTCCGDTVRWFHDGTFKLLPISFNCANGFCTNARARFTEATTAWNSIVGADMHWDVTLDDDNSRTERGDGTEVGFFSERAPAGVIAATLVKWGACLWPACDEEISETDIKFYVLDSNGDTIFWDTTAVPGAYFHSVQPDPNGDPAFAPSDWVGPSGAGESFVVVASHEIGHAHGLEHTTFNASRMDNVIPHGGWYHEGPRVTPLAYDHQEIRRIYPGPGSGADVYALSWFQHNGDSWATTRQTAGGSDLSFYPFNDTANLGNDDCAVRVGHTVITRVCVGNNGNSAASVSGLEFYISADQRISTTDFRSPTH
jgi:hypothetical protein